MTFTSFNGAADCHFHILDEAFPTVANAVVRNMTASVEQYRAFARDRGTTKGVVVQPSLYGTNNELTLRAIEALGINYRAVVVVDDRATPEALHALHVRGGRGVRFNQVQAGATTMEMMPSLARAIANLGWHVQLHMKATEILKHAPALSTLPVPLVLDHSGRVAPDDTSRAGLDAIRRLLSGGNTWIKLSAPYLNSAPGTPHYADAVEVGRLIAAENEDRIIWGSDWPHVTEADNRPAPQLLADFALACLGNGARLQKALVDNPKSLYGF